MPIKDFALFIACLAVAAIVSRFLARVLELFLISDRANAEKSASESRDRSQRGSDRLGIRKTPDACESEPKSSNGRQRNAKCPLEDVISLVVHFVSLLIFEIDI